jgi:hypothetical protein
MVQAVEHLPSNCEGLSSNSKPPKKKKSVPNLKKQKIYTSQQAESLNI